MPPAIPTAQPAELALQAWRRRKWLAMIVFCAVCGTVAMVALSLPNLYQAAATVIVERQEVSEAFVRPSVTAELETRLQTIREAVMSRGQLADLIDRLNIYPQLRSKVPVEDLVARMRRDTDLDVKSVDSPMSGRVSTIAFTLTYTGRDPEVVARVANELARMYVQQNDRLRTGQASNTAGFLKAQVDAARKQLDALDRRQNDFKMVHLGELPQQVDTNLASIERLNTQLRLNGEDQLRLMDRRDRLEQQRADASAPPQKAPSADETQLATLTTQLADLRSRKFTDAYPDVMRLRAEIDALKDRIARQQPSAAAPAAAHEDTAAQTKALADVDAELDALKQDERSLRQSIAQYQERIESVPKWQQELQDMSGDYSTAKERYDSLEKLYEQAQLADNLEQGRNAEQFRVLDAAIPPHYPVAPARGSLLLLGVVFAVGLAIASVIAVEKMDSTFHSVDELRTVVSGGVIASLPVLTSRAIAARKRRRAALLAASVAVALLAIFAGARYVASGNEMMVHLMERSRG